MIYGIVSCIVIGVVTKLLLHSNNVTYNVSNTIENVRSHPAASRILPITEKQKKANEVAERRSIMARSAALNETNDSNSTSNETTIVLGENCDETNIEVSIRPRQDVAILFVVPGCPYLRRLGDLMYRAGFLKKILTEVLVPQAFENDKMSESL